MRAVKVILGVGVAVVGVTTGIYMFKIKPTLEFADVATAFAAKKVCSCLHVAGLSEDQCKADFTDDVSMANFIPEADGARAEVLGGRISHRAVYRDGLGCTLMSEEADLDAG